MTPIFEGLSSQDIDHPDFRQAFDQVDLILTPWPHPGLPAGEKTDDPLQMYLTDIFTISANLAGIPGLALPAVQFSGIAHRPANPGQPL